MIPDSSIKLTGEIKSAIKRMNKIMSENGKKIIVNEYYGPENLFGHIADKKKGVKKIVIVDGETSEYLNNFLSSEQSMSEANKVETFRDVRMLNVLDLNTSSNIQNGSAFQTQLLMTAIMARLIEVGDEHFLDIKSVLLDLLDGAFLNGGNGRVRMSEFIDTLASHEDATTNIEKIKARVKYFISDGRAISLIRTLQREFRKTEYFWTFA